MEINRPEAYAHYALIRRSPQYRLECMMEELQAERQPSWAQEEPETEEIKVIERPIEREDFRKLHSRMQELENKFYKHEQKKKPKLKKVSLE